MNKCKNCGQEFEGNFCPNCGTKRDEVRTCPNCGAEVSGNFCANCGQPMNKPTTEEVAPVVAQEPAPIVEAAPEVAEEKPSEVVQSRQHKAVAAPSIFKKAYKLLPKMVSVLFLLFSVVMLLGFLGAIATSELGNSETVYGLTKLAADDISDFEPYITQVCEALIAFGAISVIIGVFAVVFNLYLPLYSLKIKGKKLEIRVARIFDYACLALCFVIFLLGCILCGGASDEFGIMQPGPAPIITLLFSLIFGLLIAFAAFSRQLIGKLYKNVAEDFEAERTAVRESLSQPIKPQKPVKTEAAVMPEEPMAEYPTKEPVSDSERMKCTWLVRGMEICFYMLFGMLTLFIVPIIFIIKTLKKRKNFCTITNKSIPIATIVLSIVAILGLSTLGQMFYGMGNVGMLKYINDINKATVKSQREYLTKYAYDKEIATGYKYSDIVLSPRFAVRPYINGGPYISRYELIFIPLFGWWFVGSDGMLMYSYVEDADKVKQYSDLLDGNDPEFDWRDIDDFRIAVALIRNNFPNKELFLEYVNTFDRSGGQIMKELKELSLEIVQTTQSTTLLSALQDYPYCFDTLDYDEIAQNHGYVKYDNGERSFYVPGQNVWQTCLSRFERYKEMLDYSYSTYGYQFMDKLHWENMVSSYEFIINMTGDGIAYKVWNYGVKSCRTSMTENYLLGLIPTFACLFMVLYIAILCTTVALFIIAQKKAKKIFATKLYKKDPQYQDILAKFEENKPELMEEYNARRAEYDSVHKQYVQEYKQYVLSYIDYKIDCAYYEEGVPRKR